MNAAWLEDLKMQRVYYQQFSGQIIVFEKSSRDRFYWKTDAPCWRIEHGPEKQKHASVKYEHPTLVCATIWTECLFHGKNYKWHCCLLAWPVVTR